MSFHAYVFFSGDCAAAFQRYHEVFGGELSLMRNGDAPQMCECRIPTIPSSCTPPSKSATVC